MYFPSKKGILLSIILWGSAFACFLPILTGRDYGTLFFSVPLAVFLLWSWFSTGYHIADGKLLIRSGPVKKSIAIHEIRSIARSRNPLASYALSMDRLEIIYGSTFDMILISPKHQDQFIEMLKQIHPPIEIKP